eukprot:jgi/Botrbrau1/7101/Bobra.0165s0122.1
MLVSGKSAVQTELGRQGLAMDVVSGGKMIQSHLKRCRSPVPTRLCDLGHGLLDPDDSLDNLRSNKRYLSEAMAMDLSRLTVKTGAPTTSGTRGETPDRLQVSKEFESPSLHSSMMSVDSSPRCCVTPRLPETAIQPSGNISGSPSTTCVQSPMETDGGFRTPMSASAGPLFLEPLLTPTHTSRRSRLSGTNGNSERVPASPSDVQLGEDLRKTVMRRALMKAELRNSNEGKVPPTPLCRPRFPCSETRNREKRLDFQRETALHIPEHAILDLGEVSSVQNFSGPMEVLGTPPRMRTGFYSDL